MGTFKVSNGYSVSVSKFVEGSSSQQKLYADSSSIEALEFIEPATMTLSADGSKWICICHQDVSNGKPFFPSPRDNAKIVTNYAHSYSLLNYLNGDLFKNTTTNKYEFLITYPELGSIIDNNYNRWKQTKNPFDVSHNNETESSMGYEGITIKWNRTNHNWGCGLGLSSSGNTLLDTEVGSSGYTKTVGNWFGAVGQVAGYDNNRIPAVSGDSVYIVDLWVRTDGTKYKGFFNLYDTGAIVASEIKEE